MRKRKGPPQRVARRQAPTAADAVIQLADSLSDQADPITWKKTRQRIKANKFMFHKAEFPPQQAGAAQEVTERIQRDSVLAQIERELDARRRGRKRQESAAVGRASNPLQ